MPATPTIDRAALLKEAMELEQGGGEWKFLHVMAVLNCARSTVYDTAWLMAIAKRVGKRGLRWNPAEVRNRGPIDASARARRQQRTGS